MKVDEKKYGDELFIYAMTLTEEIESKKLETKNGENQDEENKADDE